MIYHLTTSALDSGHLQGFATLLILVKQRLRQVNGQFISKKEIKDIAKPDKLIRVYYNVLYFRRLSGLENPNLIASIILNTLSKFIL